jgi:hypothetical protein
MSASQVAVPSAPARPEFPRAAAWVHYASLLVGAAVLLYLARDQWFFFDEWDIIWGPEASRRFIEGHNGHWSAVPIAVWTALQAVFGLSSYLPFIAMAVIAHLAVAHLLWRILRRIDVSAWIGTALVTVFVFLGSASENLLWAFQMGFMGAIAFGLGAFLLALHPALTPLRLGAIVVLLLLGAATAGTALPLFVAVGAIVLFQHGWLKVILSVGVPGVVYVTWYLFVAGPNPTEIYRAQGIGRMLEGIPAFIATMFVGAYDQATPVPGFGIIVMTGLAVWGLLIVAGRRLTLPTAAALFLFASGVIFAALTGYSRLELGVDLADSSRYIYVVIGLTIPALALALTRAAQEYSGRIATIVVLAGVVAAFNVGALAVDAGGEATRELTTRAVVSAALDLADEHPDAISAQSRPDPTYLPRTLGEMRALQDQYGLTTIDYGDDARLTALLTVGLTAEGIATAETCNVGLQPGSIVVIDPEGVQLQTTAGASLTVYANDGDARGLSQNLTLEPGATRLSTVVPALLVIEHTSAPVSTCQGSVQ